MVKPSFSWRARAAEGDTHRSIVGGGGRSDETPIGHHASGTAVEFAAVVRATADKLAEQSAGWAAMSGTIRESVEHITPEARGARTRMNEEELTPPATRLLHPAPAAASPPTREAPPQAR